MHRSRNLTGIRILIPALLCLLATPAVAELLCRAEVDRNSAVVGGTVVLTVRAEGQVTGSVDFRLPAALSPLVSGTSYSRSQTINGGRSTITIAKTFYLSVRQAGKMVIGPIVVSDDNGQCQTEAISVEVTAAPDRVPPAVSGNRVAPPNSGKSSSAGPTKAGGKPGDDIFITLEADRNTAWVGQQIVLVFRYYHRVNPWNQPQFTAPRTPGFWREDLGPQQDFRTTVGGRAYNVTEIRYAIFPTRAGELVIDQAELSFPDQGLDRFFSSRRRQGPRVLRTESIPITVKELPAGQPEDFSGLVAGQVRLTARADRDSVPRGEPVDFQVRLVSDAFLKSFQGLKVPEPEGTRIHDAGDDFRTLIEQKRLMGQITLEKVLVPEQEGRLQLPGVSLTWFDVNRGQYRTTNAPVRPIIVTASDNPYAGEEDSGFLRSQVSRLGQDLVFIHNVPDGLGMNQGVLVEKPVWWILLLLPVFLLVIWRVFLARRLSDPLEVSRRRALLQAKEILASADGTVATRVARSIGQLVADCTDRPLAAIGSPEVRQFCDQLGQGQDGQRLAEILESCDTARYGGSQSDYRDEDLVQEVTSVLTRLHRLVLGTKTSGKGPATVTRLLPLFTLGLLLVFNQSASALTDPARLMAEGNQAYTEGRVDIALDLYKQAESLGVNDPDLFFNLGNVHARRGELGHAVANYLRAERLAPRDQDIKDNLAWVRGNIQDLELNEGELPLFIAQAVALVFGLTLGQWGIILLVLVWILCGLLALRQVKGGNSDRLRRLLLAFAAAVLTVSVIVGWRWRIEEVRHTAVVVVEEVAVRSGPDQSFPVLFQVHDGLTIRIQEERRQWVRISLGGESLGWMPQSSVEKVRRDS